MTKTLCQLCKDEGYYATDQNTHGAYCDCKEGTFLKDLDERLLQEAEVDITDGEAPGEEDEGS